MALKGEAKKLYQREYMRKRRAISRMPKPYRIVTHHSVRPVVRPPQIDPVLDPSPLDLGKAESVFVTPIPKPTKKKRGRAIWLR